MLGHSRERAARLSYRVQAHGDTHLKGQVSISAIQDNKGERGRKGKLNISRSYRGAFLLRHPFSCLKDVRLIREEFLSGQERDAQTPKCLISEKFIYLFQVWDMFSLKINSMENC